jgi:hypothetical protein
MENTEAYFLGNGKPLTPVNVVNVVKVEEEHVRAAANL